MNHYIFSSGARGVGAFEVGFDQNGPDLKQGTLCSVSDRLKFEVGHKPPYVQDKRAVDVFISDEVVLRKWTSLEQLRTAFPYGYAPLALSTLEEAGPFMRDKAFQVAFKLPESPMPKAWADMIVCNGYSWNWYGECLVVANTKSAVYGIPPNFAHLGLRKLELKFRTEKICGAAGPLEVFPKPVECASSDYAGDNWKKAMTAFRVDPSLKTMTALTSDQVVHGEFLRMKGLPEYCPGSKKNKWTTVLVDKFYGPSNATSFVGLAKALEDISAEDSDLTQFILVKKLAGQAKVTVDQETIHYVK
jgi:hypothetical protein